MPPKRGSAERQGVAWCFGGLNQASKANHAAIGQCVENCNGSAGGVAIQWHSMANHAAIGQCAENCNGSAGGVAIVCHRSGLSKKPTGGVLKNQKVAGARGLLLSCTTPCGLIAFCNPFKVHGGDFLIPPKAPTDFLGLWGLCLFGGLWCMQILNETACTGSHHRASIFVFLLRCAFWLIP